MTTMIHVFIFIIDNLLPASFNGVLENSLGGRCDGGGRDENDDDDANSG